MGNPAFSAGVSLLLTIVIVAVGQVFKEQLAASRQGTLLAGSELHFFKGSLDLVK